MPEDFEGIICNVMLLIRENYWGNKLIIKDIR